MTEHVITNPADLLTYLRSGNATFTIKSLKTGTRYTYKVQAPGKRTDKGGFTKDYESTMRFVKVLTGPNNEDDYQYIGIAPTDGGGLVAGRKGNAAHPAFKALNWVIAKAILADNMKEEMPEQVEFWHAGSCGRCGRTLTDPASIERGIGPECANKV